MKQFRPSSGGLPRPEFAVLAVRELDGNSTGNRRDFTRARQRGLNVPLALCLDTGVRDLGAGTYESAKAAKAASSTPPTTFEELFAQEAERMYRALCLMTANPAEAEDILQDAFATVWERWERVAAMESPGAYLQRVAVNLFRRRARRAALLRRLAARPVPVDEYERSETRQSVQEFLASVTPRQRAAIVLTELLGYDSETAGRMLGITAGTVRALRSQGHAAIRRKGEGKDD